MSSRSFPRPCPLPRRLAAALLALTLATAPAAAEHRAATVPLETAAMPALLAVVAAWVGLAFDLPAPAALPAVGQASRERLAELVYGGAPGAGASASVEGAYDTETRTILLPTGWTGTTPAELSVLVHEMVHHLQTEAELRHACPAEREGLAYAAQARWLEQSGSSLQQAFGIDAMTLMVRTHCWM